DIRQREEWRELLRLDRAEPFNRSAETAGPGETCFERSWMPCQRRSNLRTARGLGAEIRDRCRNGIRGNAEDTGERNQRHVRIVRGQRIVGTVHGSDPGSARKEPDEWLRCADQHARAARSKRLRETDELQRVAETLLGGEEQRATGRRRAVPARPRPRPLVARQFGNPVAPFVFAPAFFE